MSWERAARADQSARGAWAGLVDYSSDSDVELIEPEPVSPQDVVLSLLTEVLCLDVVRAASRPTFRLDHAGFNPQEYRAVKRESVWDEESLAESVRSELSSSSSSSSSSSEDEETAVGLGSEDEAEKVTARQPLRTKKEVLHVDLPAIEDLHISVPAHECVELGSVCSWVDDLVVVKTVPGTAAIDLESVLFLDHGARPLGRVFDVFGPVVQPFYSVRFNSESHIRERDLTIGMPVYYAPRTEHVSFVFLDQLRRLKGTDSSWRHDEETPVHRMEFSDDEEESRTKRHARQAKKRPERPEVAAKKPCAPASAHNLFYRRPRRYNPRDYGPIRWDSLAPQAHFPSSQGAAPTSGRAFRAPPPPAHGPSVSQAFYYGQQSVNHFLNHPPPPIRGHRDGLPNPFAPPPPPPPS